MSAPRISERRTIVSEIESVLARAHSDGTRDVPRTLVIAAGPGSGKTHTLRALTDGLVGQVRFAGADELSWRQPFGVAADLLGAELPAPIPEGFGDKPYALVDAMCAERPLVLVLDDAHNADAASLELIFRLSGAARDLPLVILLGRRHLPERELLVRLLARPGVHEWQLPPLADAELDALTVEYLGATPDSALRALLSTSGGNPMHAISLLRSLEQSHRLDISDGAASVIPGTDADLGTETTDVIAGHLALLGPDARALAQKLAVWGGPATLADLAALDGSAPAALVGAAQTAIDAGIIGTDDAGALAFTHDLYADVTYRQLDPTLRAVLHDAVANHPSVAAQPQMSAHHTLAAGTDESTIADAVRRAEIDLENTPAVAVDLLDSVATRTDGGSPPRMHSDLAMALARSGQLDRASDVAAEGLAHAADIDEITNLHSILLFALINKGDTDRACELIDETLQLPVGDEVTETLRDLRSYNRVLDGSEPIPLSPLFDVDTETQTRSVPGVVGEGLRRFLVGDLDEALRLSLLASRRAGDDNVSGVSANSSADVWPPLIELFAHGPNAAAELLTAMSRLRTSRAADWMTSYHELSQGGVEFWLGNFDDATATWETALERLSSADMGWTSLAEGGLAMMEVFRGDITAASTRLDEWDRTSLRNQFGMPEVERARVLLLESTRRLRPAAQLAAETWTHAEALHLYTWLPAFALDCARVGSRARDSDLLDLVVRGLDAMPHPPTPAMAAVIEVAHAMRAGDTAAVMTTAEMAAAQLASSGSMVSTACALEESACAAALLGEKTAARDAAGRALTLTQSMGATSMSARIASRLRPLGLRIDPTAVRDRPRHGWESLTKTEVTVAELVAAGLSGSEIAARLFISPRTVQTHVSHALSKLGLRTRVELAAYVAGR
ncbi:LuxR C-terminal-related transcriptional regulator [Gordonia sp. NPDC003422]